MRLLSTIHHCDVTLFHWLHQTKIHRELTTLARLASKTGDGHGYVLIGLGLGFLEGFDSMILKTLSLAFIVERLLYFVLKNSFKRNRPERALSGFISLITPSDQFSFPSGHTSAAFMMATVLSFFFPYLLLPLTIWASLVGFARIVLGVHFPTDVLIGAIMGTSLAFATINLMI